MDVMHRLHPAVRECDALTPHHRRKHARVKVALGIDRIPTFTDEMARMQDRYGKAVIAGRTQEVALDLCLADSVVAERCAGHVFRRRYLNAMSVNPDGTAMEKVLYSPAQRRRQLDRAFRGIAGKVNDDLCVERCDLFTKSAGA